MITLRHVDKQYGSKWAVRDLNLEVPAGEFFAFLGPNGAGKTTTIKMIAGLLKPTAGTIEVCGHPVERDAIQAKSVMAYIPDEPFIYDKLTGREFLEFVGRMYRVSRADLVADMNGLIEKFDMGGYIDELTETYSHGMKQRLAIGAALIHKPKVIVVDEPLVGLDPVTSKIVKDTFKQQSRDGVTVFMSTHLLSIAEEVADRVGIIMNGTVVALGSCEDVKRNRNGSATLEEAFFQIVEGQEPE
jgi:ABC-2 type transport system ATP-binding protein